MYEYNILVCQVCSEPKAEPLGGTNVKIVWYFHLFKKFPQFVVIHMVKGFREVNE